MVDYIIVEGKTLDEALEEALKDLDTSKENVKVEIIEEGSSGFLGIIGSKNFKLKVSLKKDIKKEAKEFLSGMVARMDIEAEIEVEDGIDNLLVNISRVNSRDKGILIGKRGNTLDALQYLLSLAINRGQEDYRKVLLDIEGYRKKREETLIRLARRMADKAIESGRLVKLEPMNPYERRIIHSCLQDYKGVRTYSEGKDPYRKIVIEAE